ncbi:hypothetical protein HanRHA438_Chr17g0821451 [Helianthus annuus]|nr:hypothetical protein HanRHA438_Chr17g0821451 [Helianthus annuus]
MVTTVSKAHQLKTRAIDAPVSPMFELQIRLDQNQAFVSSSCYPTHRHNGVRFQPHQDHQRHPTRNQCEVSESDPGSAPMLSETTAHLDSYNMRSSPQLKFDLANKQTSSFP